MTDVNQALFLGVAFPVEVLVPRFQLGEEASEELFRRCFVLGVSVDVHTAVAWTGGWTTPEVLRSRGALGLRSACQKSMPKYWPNLWLKIIWGSSRSSTDSQRGA